MVAPSQSSEFAFSRDDAVGPAHLLSILHCTWTGFFSPWGPGYRYSGSRWGPSAECRCYCRSNFRGTGEWGRRRGWASGSAGPSAAPQSSAAGRPLVFNGELEVEDKRPLFVSSGHIREREVLAQPLPAQKHGRPHLVSTWPGKDQRWNSKTRPGFHLSDHFPAAITTTDRPLGLPSLEAVQPRPAGPSLLGRDVSPRAQQGQ